MRLSLIAAMAQNCVIGRNNKLPWYLPEDLKYFKRVTMGKPLIMGRKTFESLGKPLPGRPHIIITRDETYTYPSCHIVHDLQSAKTCAESLLLIDGGEEVVVIGGAEIYGLMLPEVDRMYLTKVHQAVEGDAYFPKYNADDWTQLAREDFSAEPPNAYDYSFVVYERKCKPS
ncbi:MAG: dihydrofolate reductase [Pseudomonadales bacterium]|nr:dihydrofolate reductase [Pseudomonadales bacterium]